MKNHTQWCHHQKKMLNTSCTNYMWQNELFVDLNETFRSELKFADDMTLVQLKNDNHQFIYELFFVPNMESNLLNLGNSWRKAIIWYSNMSILLCLTPEVQCMFRIDIKNGVYPCLRLL